MDREELVKLLGELALLERELAPIKASLDRDRERMQTYCSAFKDATTEAWLESGVAALTRIHAHSKQSITLGAQIIELKKRTAA